MQSDKQTADSTEINSEEEIVLLVKQDIRNFPLLYDKYVDQAYKYFYPEFKTAKSLKI